MGLKYKQICFTISQKLAELLPRDISCCDRMNIENVVKSNCSRRNAVHWVQVYIELMWVCTSVHHFSFLKSNLFATKECFTSGKNKYKKNNDRRKSFYILRNNFYLRLHSDKEEEYFDIKMISSRKIYRLIHHFDISNMKACNDKDV